jgi:NADH-quinone oxidoreductase subunit G
MPQLLIDGQLIDVPADYTLLQACEEAGAEVPRFCFHERLSIAGNCRMCLVEVKGTPKPQASCAMAVKDLRPGPNGEPPVVNTRTPLVKKAREGVMEFLLINHPLDCPICDQGGECDLQDQAMAYGVDSSRFHENKRAVEDKYMGPLVKTSMNRCIHCTRCVRFITEVTGVADLGAIGRGEDMEITTYLEKALESELQGNVVDLCPVGALTSKPYAFTARPWELSKTESIDVMDAVGSNIRVDARGREVVRVLPRLNEEINEEWISDKTRHVADGLRTQRLDQPYVRINGQLQPASWPQAFEAIAQKVKTTSASRVGALAGDLAGVEELYALKLLLNKLGSPHYDARVDGTILHPDMGRGAYLFNAGIAAIEKADSIIIIGSNPRKEAAILNARLRKRYRMGGAYIAVIGEQADLTYPYTYLGAGVDTLNDLVSGKLAFADVLKNAKNPLIIIGQGALIRDDSASVLALAAKLAQNINAVRDDWNGWAVLHTGASRVGALDVGFVPQQNGFNAAQIAKGDMLDVIFALSVDEIDIGAGAFVVYIGTHGDRGAHRADVILPSATYTEKSGTYVNTEGRVQMTRRAAFPVGEAKEDWAILRALSDVLGQTLPFNNLSQLRQKLYEAYPHLAQLNVLPSATQINLSALSAKTGQVSSQPFVSTIRDFYLTNPILRASAVMAECSALASTHQVQAAE